MSVHENMWIAAGWRVEHRDIFIAVLDMFELGGGAGRVYVSSGFTVERDFLGAYASSAPYKDNLIESPIVRITGSVSASTVILKFSK